MVYLPSRPYRLGLSLLSRLTLCGLGLLLVCWSGGAALGQNLIYLDLTTHGDDRYYEDSSDIKNSFQTYGQRADLSIIDLQGRIETTQQYFLDVFKATYSNRVFYQSGLSFQVAELSPLITRTVRLGANYGFDGFYNVNDGDPPEFSDGFHSGNGTLEISHNQQLSPRDSMSVDLSYTTSFKENDVAKNDTLLSYNWAIGYDRQFNERVTGGINLSRNETINQDDAITIVTSSALNSTQNLTPRWTLTENLGVSQFQNSVGKDLNTVGGIQASYSYGATLNEEIKNQTLEAEGEKKLPDDEYRTAIDKILNPEQPDVLGFGWQREIATVNQGQDRRLADTFNLSWQHILSPSASVVLSNNRTHETNVGNSATANSIRNNLGIALTKSVKWFNFSYSRTPEQQFTLSYTYERFKQGQFWSDFTIANIAFKALL